METISKFQFIRMDSNRVVIRFYNEEKDKFEKICSAHNFDLYDKVLIADERFYYEFEGKLHLIGYKKEVEEMLRDIWFPARLGVLKVTTKASVPFKALLLIGGNNHDEYVPVLSYMKIEDEVRVVMLNGEKVTYFIDHDFDNLGHCEGSFVAVR